MRHNWEERLQKKKKSTDCCKRVWRMPNIRATSYCVEIGTTTSGGKERGFSTECRGIWDRGENVEGERILDFAKINNLSIMTTYYKHCERQTWKWYRYGKQTQSYTQLSMIDLFFSNNKGLVLDVKTISSVSMDADHRLVIANVWIKKSKSTGKTGINRYNLAKLSETEHVDKNEGNHKR